METVDSIVRDVFAQFDDGRKGHLSKDDFSRWMKSQPEIDEVGGALLPSVPREALLSLLMSLSA